MVAVAELGGVTKLTLHAPRPAENHPDWVVHLKRTRTPFRPSGKMEVTLESSKPYQPVEGLICACAIYVPHSQKRKLEKSQMSDLPPANLEPPRVGMQATIAIWVDYLDQMDGKWPGCNKGTRLLWTQLLGGGSRVFVVRLDEQAVSVKIPRVFVGNGFRLAHMLFQNPSASMLMMHMDDRGVGVFVDCRMAVLFLNLPKILTDRFAPKVGMPLRAVIWLLLLRSEERRVGKECCR